MAQSPGSSFIAQTRVVVTPFPPHRIGEATAFLAHVLEHARKMPNSLAWVWVERWCVRNGKEPTMSSLWLFLAEYSYFEMLERMVGIAEIADEKSAELETKYAKLKAKHAKLEEKHAKHAELEAKHAELEAKHAKLEAKHAKLEAEYAKLKVHAKSMFEEGTRLQEEGTRLERLNARAVQALETAHIMCEELREQLGTKT